MKRLKVPKLSKFGLSKSWLPKRLKHYTPGFAEKVCLGVVLGIIMLPLLAYAAGAAVFADKVYPGISVDGVQLGNLTKQQATTVLMQQQFNEASSSAIVLTSSQRTWTVTADQLGLQIDATISAQRAFGYGRSANPVTKVKQQVILATKGMTLPPIILVDSQKLQAQLDPITQALTTPPQSAKISYVSGQFVIGPAVEGTKVDVPGLTKKIEDDFQSTNPKPITVPLTVAQPALSVAQAQAMLPSLQQYASQPLELTYSGQKFPIDIATLLTMINSDNVSNGQFTLSDDQLNMYVAKIATQIDQPVKDAMFQFADGKAQEFVPSQNGVSVDRQQLAQKISQALVSGQGSRVIPIPVSTTASKVSMADVNSLGITQLIAHGESNYQSSIGDRIFNIHLAASRINGTLIAPGDEFSFNNAVGDVSVATGFRQALVILSGQTVLGDGGGVCQVSTTVFRAALNAGVPITQRTSHSYRVSYYENDMGPGFDATIYQPGVDFRFKNDTGHYILLQATVDDAHTKLSIDLYGTSDGRVTTLSKSKYLSTTPAPPDIHKDDPTLPKGTVKQVEHSIPGAKVVFTRTVVRDGQTIIDESFYSNYVPWAAVFLDGTKT